MLLCVAYVRTTQRNIPEDGILHSDRRENQQCNKTQMKVEHYATKLSNKTSPKPIMCPSLAPSVK
jgi:hypothetical protein